MEIKRRLNKIAGRFTPQIEVMNVNIEMRRICDRLEELLNYAEEKMRRAEERNGNTIGKQAHMRREEADRIINEHQNKESDENLADQIEAFKERNRGMGGTFDIPPEYAEASEEAKEKPTLVSHPGDSSAG